jgi:hypothetical protein
MTFLVVQNELLVRQKERALQNHAKAKRGVKTHIEYGFKAFFSYEVFNLFFK